eukprot:CAMPEP_0205812806 /NCGR_PEP_ID=MMETSP0205-20121125/17397_1 /ASSEMBLY_ACC=CAM_ASM_000278 /TAXON_ID=36767 /ORGANISM="Euplotes focardii, Strain TN1" /LENGTH=221 /DNA_ID=CAMNT_0053094127 /DNA_START=136 /DNA_END=798 /DNA_ORIENTATION=-
MQFVELLFQMDVIEDEEFYQGEEMYSEEAKYLLNSIDVNQTDQIIFSEIVKLLTTHPAQFEQNPEEPCLEQISVLEKFVTKAIEAEESQKRIMIKLQERIIEENKNEEQLDNYEVREEDKLLYDKSNFNPKSFENLETQVLDDLKQDYERLGNYQPNRLEHEFGDHIIEEVRNKEINYLVRGLDPVEEDDKEEQSQKSAKDSLRKITSLEFSNPDNEEEEL